MKNIDSHEIELDKLMLDIKNPRFAELYNGSEEEDDLIEYLLYTESGDEIADGIKNAGGFYPDRPLWVIKDNDKYLVKDGNRRCAAVKALQFPEKFGLNLTKMLFNKLPVLIYKRKEELDKRILQEHTANLFKEWDRIAKALEVYKLYKSGSSIESMKEIDTSPKDLIKLASFYYEAVKIGGENLKKLLRRGRGKTGGKTIIFERLFKYSESCGYKFKNKPYYKIYITNTEKFSKYILALVDFLENNPNTTHKNVDENGTHFITNLKKHGFDATEIETNSKKNSDGTTDNNKKQEPLPLPISNINKSSTKTKPTFERKLIPRPLKKLIAECYNLNNENFSNAKTALTRVSLECTLKFVVEKTKYKSKDLCKYDFFKNAFFDKKGNKAKHTNFESLKNLFTELVINKGLKNAFFNFDLQNPNQIIHNYNVGAIPADAQALCDNLIPLLEFMLQDENNLLKSLNITKLI